MRYVTQEELWHCASILNAAADKKSFVHSDGTVVDWRFWEDSNLGYIVNLSIKPEPRMRHLTRDELMEHCRVGTRVVSKNQGHAASLHVQNFEPMLGVNKITPSMLYEDYTWLSGAPCGVLEE